MVGRLWIHNAAAGEEETRDIEAANRRLALASSGGAPQRLYDCHKGNVISDTVTLLGLGIDRAKVSL